MARRICSGSATSFTSTVLTLMPHGSVSSSMIDCSCWLTSSRWESRPSRSVWPMTERRVVCEICEVARTKSRMRTTAMVGSTTRK